MGRTISRSARVGEVWTHSDGSHDVEIVGEHEFAGLVLLRRGDLETEWVPRREFEDEYEQSRCGECGVPLTAMRKLLVEEAKRNNPHGGGGVVDGQRTTMSASEGPSGFESRAAPPKATPGTYCTESCCWPPRAPATC
jgi:hypothetical protein